MKDSPIKLWLKRKIFKEGSVQTIFWGPLRGYKYVVNKYSSWSHLYGGWEPHAQKLYARFIKKGWVVYDIGANTGIHSLLFSKLTRPSGRVYAFEPLPANVREIQSVIELNSVKNINIVPAAVSDSSGLAVFNLGANSFQGALTQKQSYSPQLQVNTITLDDFLKQGNPKPDFIKMDIEGGEGAALKGFNCFIKSCRPFFAIDSHSPEQDLKVGKFFKENGYIAYRLRNHSDNNSRKLLTRIKYLEKSWPDPDGIWGTVVGIPEESGYSENLC